MSPLRISLVSLPLGLEVGFGLGLEADPSQEDGETNLQPGNQNVLLAPLRASTFAHFVASGALSVSDY